MNFSHGHSQSWDEPAFLFEEDFAPALAPDMEDYGAQHASKHGPAAVDHVPFDITDVAGNLAHMLATTPFAQQVAQDTDSILQLIPHPMPLRDQVELVARSLPHYPGFITVVRNAAVTKPLHSFHHTFIILMPVTHNPHPGAGDHFIIDINFQGTFNIASESARYQAILSMLPQTFVGAVPQLKAIATLMAAEIASAFETYGRTLPPWRKAKGLLSHWFPSKFDDTFITDASRLTPNQAAMLAAHQPSDPSPHLSRSHNAPPLNSSGGGSPERRVFGFHPAQSSRHMDHADQMADHMDTHDQGKMSLRARTLSLAQQLASTSLSSPGPSSSQKSLRHSGHSLRHVSGEHSWPASTESGEQMQQFYASREGSSGGSSTPSLASSGGTKRLQMRRR